MKQHKHNPCSAYSPARRFFEFCIQPQKYLDWKSQTGRCDKCMKLLIAPDFLSYIVWTPAINGFIIAAAFKPMLYIKLPDVMKLLILLAALFICVWIVPASILAFGKWKAPEQGDMTDEEFLNRQIREVRYQKERIRYGWQYKASVLLCIAFVLVALIVFAGPYRPLSH